MVYLIDDFVKYNRDDADPDDPQVGYGIVGYLIVDKELTDSQMAGVAAAMGVNGLSRAGDREAAMILAGLGAGAFD